MRTPVIKMKLNTTRNDATRLGHLSVVVTKRVVLASNICVGKRTPVRNMEALDRSYCEISLARLDKQYT